MLPLLLYVALSPAQSTSIDRAALEPAVNEYLESSHTAGAVVALVQPGKAPLVEPFGLADRATQRAMSADTRFQVGSVTKPITATCIARLAQRGLLDWSDPLGKHVSDLPEPLQEITLLQLATHTSGLPREPVNRVNLPDTPSVMAPMSTRELLAGLATTRITGEGGRWDYSNLGYAILGAVVEAVGEADYPQLAAELVLEPLEMSDSGVFLGDESPARLAACYWPEDEADIERTPWRFGTASGFCGLTSTAGDLARFLEAQLGSRNGAFLADAGWNALHEARVQIDEETGRKMAAGWLVEPLPGGLQALAHGGEVDGHSAVIAFFPALEAGVVVLCNRGGNAAEGLSRAVMGVVLQRLMPR